MAKKAPAPKAPAGDSSQQLVHAIVTVRNLQDFIQAHGGLDKALAAVTRVHDLITMTGGIDQLKQALEIVGQEPASQEPCSTGT
jgi:hypothetical protein